MNAKVPAPNYHSLFTIRSSRSPFTPAPLFTIHHSPFTIYSEPSRYSQPPRIPQIQYQHPAVIHLAFVKNVRRRQSYAKFPQHPVPADPSAAVPPSRPRRVSVFVLFRPRGPQTDHVALPVVQQLIRLRRPAPLMRTPADHDVPIPVYRRVQHLPPRFLRPPRRHLPIPLNIHIFRVRHNGTRTPPVRPSSYIHYSLSPFT